MTETRTQWHPQMGSAIELEYPELGNLMEAYFECLLYSKPLQIDVLIKKNTEFEVANATGKIFKKHNIIEYKSPGDELNIDTYHKVLAYTNLYQAGADTVGEIKDEDISITFIREGKPVKLFKELQSKNMVIRKIEPGIYYVEGAPYAMQFLVTKEFNPHEHIWLKSLTRNMTLEEARILSEETAKVQGKKNRENAEAILQLAYEENREVFEQLKREDSPMCEAIRDLFKEEWEEEERKFAERMKDQTKALEEKQKSFEENKKSFEENKKSFEENKKSFEENRKSFEENRKSFEENRKSFEENKKSFEENRKSFEEDKKSLKEKEKILNEKQKSLEKQQKSLEIQQKNMEKRENSLSKRLDKIEKALLEKERAITELENENRRLNKLLAKG